MNYEKPLEKKLSKEKIEIPNQQNEKKSEIKNINCSKKIFIPKNGKASKENKEKLQQQKKPSDDDDYLEHPEPLLSDYYEEEKEKIKQEFYKNKLKQEENKKDNDIKSDISLIKKNKFEENKENQNINNNICLERIESNNKQENFNKKNNSKQNSEPINYIIKVNNDQRPKKKIIRIKKKNKIQKIKIKSFNEIPIPKKEISINQEEIENSMNKNPSTKGQGNENENKEIKNSQNKIKIINKIQQSMYKCKDLIYQNSMNNTIENEQNPFKINIEKSSKTLTQNKSQMLNNNNYIKNYQNKKVCNQHKKKIMSNKGIKSQSIDCIYKIPHYSCSNLNKNNTSLIKVDNPHNEKIMKTNSDLSDNVMSTSKYPNHKVINYINKTAEKDKKINKIPIPKNSIKNELNNNSSVSNVKFYNIPKSNNYSCSNLCNKIKLNKIHNNNNFYQSNEQKENIQNNSEFQKKTYDIGGKFNNVQTTYVVKAKNSTSKLIPKNHKTIDYENNQPLNSDHSTIQLKSSHFYSQDKNYNLNTERNIYQNRNSEYSSFKNNNYVQISSTYQPKINKSQNNIHLKNTYNNNSIYTSVDKNNYGINYNSFNKSSNYGNKSQTYNNKNVNYYTVKKSQSNRIDTFDTYDNCYYYNYGNAENPNNIYFAYSTNNRYNY